MSDFDITRFIFEVDVFNDNSKGHYERRNKAKESYLKYPCYKDWKKDSKDVLKKDNYSIRADILTSIKTPINIMLDATGIVPLTGYGWDIKRLFDQQTDEYKVKYQTLQEIIPYCKCFSMVYYWVGNMMPVIRNFSAQANDTWKFKLDCIQRWWNGETHVSGKEAYEREYIDWIYFMNNEMNIQEYQSFITSNYLNDMVDSLFNTKPMVSYAEYDGWQLKKTSNAYVVKEWFVNNAKIIIQRSYRIVFDFKKDWESSLSDKKNVESIIKHVFKEAGVKEPIELF